MYIHGIMETGAVPPSPRESIINTLNVQILSSFRQTLGIWWHMRILSPFWRLYVNNRSGAQICVADKTIALQPDKVYLIPAWLPFETRISRPVVQDYLHFNIPSFAPALHRQIFTEIIELPADDLLRQLVRRWQNGFLNNPQPQAPLTNTFTDEHRSAVQPQPLKSESDWAHFAHSSALVYATMANAVEQLPHDKRDVRWRYYASDLRPAFEHIERNLRTPPSNAELAALCRCSTDHFIRRFSEVTDGVPPLQYGLQIRLAAAAQALAKSHISIDEIAEQNGFTDRFHLSRHFSKHFGLPPAAYRHLHSTAP